MTTIGGASAPLHPRPAPVRALDILRQLGPGLIISAVIVGSGELIVTPKLGATVGFSMLWFIILGCFIKVFVQIELGRYAIARGMTTLEAMNSIPGPRLIVSWLLWLWLLMYVALVFQVAGMVGGLASVFALAGLPVANWLLTVLVAASCAVLLVLGRYRLVESVSTALVVLFTLTTLVAVGALQSTPFAITAGQIAEGLKFRLPEQFTTAFAAFGIIGVGASELIYYPYWCLEKGYARNVGAHEDEAAWYARARGWLRVMRIDAWVSFAIYTTATLAFYLLGAAVLHAKGLVVENNQMIATLSHMYRETFGQWSYWLFLVGAFAVLYSTVFGATASNARLFADALVLFRVVRYRTPDDRARMVRAGCVLLPCAFATVFLVLGEPVSLVFVGALAQGLMLPFLAAAALYFCHRRLPPLLRPGLLWRLWLWLAALAMTLVGLYKVWEELRKVWTVA
ncbi:MAG TPA: Nramp family divalent metal transporter [Methylomirabilota bacterium]|nr:Nramp family divalent metal transporter [Methylomirabilota bacterium]